MSFELRAFIQAWNSSGAPPRSPSIFTEKKVKFTSRDVQYITLNPTRLGKARVHDHKLLTAPLKEGVRQANAVCFQDSQQALNLAGKPLNSLFTVLRFTTFLQPVARGYGVSRETFSSR